MRPGLLTPPERPLPAWASSPADLAGRDRTPSWAQEALNAAWEVLRKKVPAGELPIGQGSETLGCGAYGCVWVTDTPGLLCKITSDRTEATFVAAALKLPKQPPGIVHYARVLQLGGMERPGEMGGQLYMIWRESAGSPDFIRRELESSKRTGEAWFQSYRRMLGYLHSFKPHAQEVRKYLIEKVGDAAKIGQEIFDLATSAEYRRLAIGATSESSGYKGHTVDFMLDPYSPWWRDKTGGGDPTKRAAIHLAACFLLARRIATDPMLEEEDGFNLVGEALEYYLSYGILLADVHGGNVGIGRPIPGADFRTVITDPGQAVFLGKRWKSVRVPLLNVPNVRKIKTAYTIEEADKLIRDALHRAGFGTYWFSGPETLYGLVRTTPTGPQSFRIESIGPRYTLFLRINVTLTGKGAKLAVDASPFSIDSWPEVWRELRYGLSKAERRAWKATVTESIDRDTPAQRSPNPRRS